MFAVEASAEGRIDGLRWTLKLTAEVAAKTLETLTQKLVEEVEAGHEEDAGMIVKTTTIEGVGRSVVVVVVVVVSERGMWTFLSVKSLREALSVRRSVRNAFANFDCPSVRPSIYPSV